MKLRCASDSIRFRVRKSDMESLEKNGHLVEQAGNHFGFALEIDPDASEMGLLFKGKVLTVSLPHGLARQWIESEEVGMEAILDGVLVVVEKDFPCEHKPTSDPHDTFRELADRKK